MHSLALAMQLGQRTKNKVSISTERGVQVTYLWKAGISPIVSRAALREKQEQVTCQLKSAPSFDQQSSR
jgi:hypothetical protein